MRNVTSSICFAFLLASAARAEPIPGQVIWSDIRYGMTKDQVQAIHPKNEQVDLGNGCRAWLRPAYEGKIVVEVQLSGSGDSNCDSSVFASLKSKYGQPKAEDVKVSKAFQSIARARKLRQFGEDPKDPFDTVRLISWFTGDTLITLQLNETMHDWSVFYQPAEIKKPISPDKL
jgi:hypothetical protein